MGVIKFGTDGWRARMGREFSFRHVRLFAHAFCHYLEKTHPGRELKVVVNYDTRFLSKQFARETAKIFSLFGVKTLIPVRDAPLAAVALATVKRKCHAAINFTASFNKPIYNGIKVLNHVGAPALPRETDLIEKEIDKISGDFHFKPQYANEELIESIDVRTPYIKYIEDLIDFDSIRDSGMVIVVDNLYGCSREYLDYVLDKNGIDIESIHNFPYSSFGAVIPSCSRENLTDLCHLVREKKADIGLATDIDGDRFGIVNASGRYVNANMILPPLIQYLITVRKMEGGIVKSIATTDHVQRVADCYSRKVYNTPVGFKYVADMLMKKEAFIGVESTNGASLNRLITIKDGILFNLLVTEMMARYQQGMDEIIDDFSRRFSRLFSREVSLKKNPRRQSAFTALLEKKDHDFKGFSLKNVKHDDGVKFIFDDSWLLIRESGTSDLIRLYAESGHLKKTRALLDQGRRLLG